MEEPKPLTASQRYYQAHKTKRREYGREYYKKNRERILGAVTRKRGKAPVQVEEPVVEEHIQSPIAEYKRRGITIDLDPVLLFN
jgi:hypothetical protein